MVQYPISGTVTKDTQQEFYRLVVEKETTKCWSWIGQYGADGRPIFRGEKAYRVMYELRNGDVPVGFHVHHKCENSACVNPRHLVALSPEDHRAVHSTKDRTIKEQIYRGEWKKIQVAKAEAQRLERERLERQRIERERQRLERERLAEIERQQLAALAAEEERKKQLLRLERRGRLALRLRKLFFYGSLALVCVLIAWLFWPSTDSLPTQSSEWRRIIVAGFGLVALVLLILGFEED